MKRMMSIGLLAFLTAVLTITRLDAVRAELDRAVRDSDPAATPERLDQVVDLLERLVTAQEAVAATDPLAMLAEMDLAGELTPPQPHRDPDALDPAHWAALGAWWSAAGLMPTDVRLIHRTLEDVFLEVAP